MTTETITLDQLPKLEDFHDDSILYVVLNNQDYHITAKQFKQLILDNLPPGAIPEGLIDENRLQEVVNTKVSPEQLTEAIRTAIEQIPGQSLPSNVVTEENLASKVEGLNVFTAITQSLNQLEAKEVYTKQEISQLFSNFSPTLPSDLVNNQQLQEAISGIQIPSLENVVTTQQLQQALDDIPTPPSIPTDLVTEQQLQEALESITVPSTEDFATTIALEQGLEAKLNKPAALTQAALLGLVDGELVAASVQQGKVYFVNPLSTSTKEDGSIFNPYKTIQAAIDAAPSTSVINLAPGSHRGDINQTKQNILIQGLGCIDSNLVEIVGTITLTGTNSTRFRLKDLQLKNSAVDNPVLVVQNSPMRHYFNNVSIEPLANTSVAPVQFLGTNSNWFVFANSNIGGDVLLSGTPAANTSIYFQGAGHAKMHVDIESNYNTVFQHLFQLRGVTHKAGNLFMSNTTNFGDKGFVSTAESVGIRMEFVSFRKADGTFAPYEIGQNVALMQDYCITPNTD